MTEREDPAYETIRERLRSFPEEKLYCIKVGANDGLTGDPFGQLLLEDKRWHGLMLEPVPHCFERLKANFCDGRFAKWRLAVSDVPGRREFYYVDPELETARPDIPCWAYQIGSFDKQHVLKHFNGLPESFLRSEYVLVDTLDSVAKDLVVLFDAPRLDLLHIDTEGHDYKVLRTYNWALTPRVIVVEHCHLPNEELYPLLGILMGRGYQVEATNMDYICVLPEGT